VITRWLPTIACTALLVAAYPAAGQPSPPRSFAVQNDHFELDGKTFQIISGEMHYPRIPRAYWRQRFQMARAMGLNAITTYVFWNAHEPHPGVYDFSGNNDVAEFIREAQQEGLYVILRPGPYVCAEWEFGGYPAWLLEDPSVVVRSSDRKFMEPAARWIKRLGQELAPLQIGNGGPIILVQVENEYGSFGNNHSYLEQVRRALVDAGFTKSQLYTADGAAGLSAGSLSDLPVGINFAGAEAGQARKEFETLRKFRPNGPFFNSEFWAGWFDHWGGKHASTNASHEADNLDWMLKQGYSVSVYMFHGGTSFGWMNGANSNGRNYEPDVTSYDYDAPLDERGQPTPKYALFRRVISEDTGTNPAAVPPLTATMRIPEFQAEQAVSLWTTLPEPVRSAEPKTMEEVGQAYGYILYRRHLNGPREGTLVVDGLHDYAQVYLDGKLAGTLDRRLEQKQLQLRVPAAGAQLDILVENTGRINFNLILRGERKGVTKQVTLDGQALSGWEIYPLPMEQPAKLPFTKSTCEGACFYRATFQLPVPADTFLDTSAFTKGQVWLNGQPLGRIWNIGPQKTLYVPAPWLRKGENEVVIFDLMGSSGRKLVGRDKPILNGKSP
jgi:beta-galactosidase